MNFQGNFVHEHNIIDLKVQWYTSVKSQNYSVFAFYNIHQGLIAVVTENWPITTSNSHVWELVVGWLLLGTVKSSGQG